MAVRLFRVILPAIDIERSVGFYAAVLQDPGVRVSPGRHYFHCEPTILAIVSPRADGAVDAPDPKPNEDHVYFSVEGVEAALERVKAAGPRGVDVPGQTKGIADRPWGERSFYCQDPAGNPICFVEAGTEFTGDHALT
jgi:catechol 2,3-dioxygenase-like lactoylglutathione lyase family enzyme